MEKVTIATAAIWAQKPPFFPFFFRLAVLIAPSRPAPSRAGDCYVRGAAQLRFASVRRPCEDFAPLVQRPPVKRLFPGLPASKTQNTMTVAPVLGAVFVAVLAATAGIAAGQQDLVLPYFSGCVVACAQFSRLLAVARSCWLRSPQTATRFCVCRDSAGGGNSSTQTAALHLTSSCETELW